MKIILLSLLLSSNLFSKTMTCSLISVDYGDCGFAGCAHKDIEASKQTVELGKGRYYDTISWANDKLAYEVSISKFDSPRSADISLKNFETKGSAWVRTSNPEHEDHKPMIQLGSTESDIAYQVNCDFSE